MLREGLEVYGFSYVLGFYREMDNIVDGWVFFNEL